MNIKPLILIAGAAALFIWYRQSQAAKGWNEGQTLMFDPLTGSQYLAPIGDALSEMEYSVSEGEHPQEISDTVGDAINNIGAKIVDIFSGWKGNKNYPQYADLIRNTESTNGIPQDLLARLLYEESRFNASAIGPMTRYGTAKGIAQFIDATATEQGVDAMDPASAIPGAGRYLKQLYNLTGSWQRALASYNFGAGNVTKGATWPTETQKYVSQITADVPVS